MEGGGLYHRCLGRRGIWDGGLLRCPVNPHVLRGPASVTRHLRSLLACLCSLGSVTVGVAVLGVCIPAGTVQAQPATPEEEEEVEEEEEEVEEPRLRAPSAEELDWREEEAEEEAGDEEETSDEEEAEEADEEEEEAIEEAEEEELPDPERVEERLDGAGSDPTIAPWTTPETIFELHGYMRMRGEFQDQFSLGRVAVAGSEDEPFLRFIPSEDGTVPVDLLAGGLLRPGHPYWVYCSSPSVLSWVASAPVETCLAAKIRSWRFPPPRSVVIVNYPFVFAQRG